MKIQPIFPIWLAAIWCVLLICLKRESRAGKLRQILIALLLFAINLRVMIPVEDVSGEALELNANVMFVVDSTISMTALDGESGQERLDDAKKDMSQIIDSMNGARFALISFHNTSQVMLPFVKDADYVKNMTKIILPPSEFYARGSSLSVCKEDLKNLLEKAREKGGRNIVFFLSDGENTSEEAQETFADLEEYIDDGLVLGYGTLTGGKMEVTDYYTQEKEYLQDNETYTDAVSYINEKNLNQIGEELGVPYMRHSSQEKLDKALEQIKSKIEYSSTKKSMDVMEDTYYFLLIPLILLLIWEWIAYKRSLFV